VSDEGTTRAELQRKAARGVPWAVLTYGGNKVVSLATTVALARLLSPDDFGLMTAALLVIGATTLVSSLGVANVLVTRPEHSAADRQTVMALLLATGAGSAALLVVGAPVLADVFRAPALTGVLRAMSVTVILNAVSWLYEMLLMQEFKFRLRFLAMLAQTVVNSVVALTLAGLGAGVWSLVAGALASSITYFAMLARLRGELIRPRIERPRARSIIKDGRGFVLQGASTFVQYNADYVAVGNVLGPRALGVYGVAYRLGELPFWAVADPVAKVTFPTFAQMHHAGLDFRPAFLSSLRMVMLVATPAAVVLSGAAGPLVDVVFGDAWAAAVGPLSVLGIWAAARPAEVIISWLLNAVGEAAVLGWVSVALLPPLVLALFLVVPVWGVTGVAWVVLGHVVTLLLVLVVVVERRAGVTARAQAAALWPILAAGTLGWCTTRAVATAFDQLPILALALSAVGGLLVYGLTILVTDADLVRATARQLRTAAGRPATGARA
jgi:PST family polysaccharide transporter